MRGRETDGDDVAAGAESVSGSFAGRPQRPRSSLHSNHISPFRIRIQPNHTAPTHLPPPSSTQSCPLRITSDEDTLVRPSPPRLCLPRLGAQLLERPSDLFSFLPALLSSPVTYGVLTLFALIEAGISTGIVSNYNKGKYGGCTSASHSSSTPLRPSPPTLTLALLLCVRSLCRPWPRGPRPIPVPHVCLVVDRLLVRTVLPSIARKTLG